MCKVTTDCTVLYKSHFKLPAVADSCELCSSALHSTQKSRRENQQAAVSEKQVHLHNMLIQFHLI